MPSKKKRNKTEREVELLSKIKKLNSEKRKIRRQIDEIDTEIIGYKEEILSIQEKERVL